MISSVQRAV